MTKYVYVQITENGRGPRNNSETDSNQGISSIRANIDQKQTSVWKIEEVKSGNKKCQKAPKIDPKRIKKYADRQT